MCCATNRTNPSGGNANDGYTADICLQNGLCMNIQNGGNTTTYWRVMCTSTDWSTGGKCLDVCADEGTAGYSGTARVTPCDGTPTSTTWCCGLNNTACCNSTSAITVPALFGATSTSTSTSSSKSTSTENATSSSPSATANNASSGLSTGAKAGVGVGVAAGAIAIIAVVVFLLRARRRSKLETHPQYPLPESTDKSAHELRGAGPLPELGSKYESGHNAKYELHGDSVGARGS
ncbi:hypothetical protein DTO271G3_7422 [Paecilomyces variotii]|nr:hypothetical protein DTO271G3_7422 [Paecilomyces variotii]